MVVLPMEVCLLLQLVLIRSAHISTSMLSVHALVTEEAGAKDEELVNAVLLLWYAVRALLRSAAVAVEVVKGWCCWW